ncbi:MAG: DUF2442 domain-containing protein [Methylovulum sp.]|nr:DUF2442 domain-containing protein [Methylovulum sp.]
MKLVSIKHQHDYFFALTFENGECKEADLKRVCGNYVSPDNLDTAQVNSEWGCLEFNNGRVDIDPKTLYRYLASQPTANAC